MNFSHLKDQAEQMMPNIDKETLLQLVREPMQKRSRTSEVLGAAALLVAGIAIGLSAGLLAAPQARGKLRQELHSGGKKVKRNALKAAKNAKDLAPQPD